MLKDRFYIIPTVPVYAYYFVLGCVASSSRTDFVECMYVCMYLHVCLQIERTVSYFVASSSSTAFVVVVVVVIYCMNIFFCNNNDSINKFDIRSFQL
jgi:hypothetical protein